MNPVLVYLLILGLSGNIKCTLLTFNSHSPQSRGSSGKLSLKIIKCTEDNYTPVSSVVEEKAGANFSLVCDLVSSETNNKYYDFQISWIKQSSDLRFWREHDSSDSTNTRKMYSILQRSEMNKAEKKFEPLKPEDRGKYFCVSLKFNLLEVVEVIVRDEKPPPVEERPYIHETIFCSERMFQCSNGVCIIHHYICDGKPDCKDGSDESVETCNGDPCKDKLHCDDGRCIPTSWCCDRHHDPNCTVTNRPKCCQALTDSYEELEYGPASVTQAHNGARYLFISICTLCILFVILLFLVLASRVVLMARKTDLEVNNRSNLESVSLHNQTTILPCEMFTYQNSRTTGLNIIDNCDVSDPLLFGGEEEQPPSYIDVIRAQNVNLNEPPPPYTSREVLNAAEERSGVEN